MADVLQALKDEVDDLTNPRQHSEPRWEWDANRNKKPLPPHVTTVPGLVQQLRELAEPGADGDQGGAGGSHSVPLRLSATSLYGSIAFGSVRRLNDAIERGARVERRSGPEDCLRALVGIAGQFPYRRDDVDPYKCERCVNNGRRGDQMHSPCTACEPTTQTELLREVRSWRYQAEIVAGWRAKPRALPAPCPRPECGKSNLVAYAEADNPRARCTECGAQWAQIPDEHEGSIDILSRYVQDYAKRAAERAAELRTAAVEERRRQAGEPPRNTPEVQDAG